MKVSEALRQRKSTRAYSDRQVEQETIMHILEAAKHSPSGANHQPWQVAVVSGAAKRELQERIEQEFAAGRRGKMDYQYYPDIWPEPYKGRRIACGVQLYDALAIARGDKQRRLEQWAANYRGFDAPVILFFFLDTRLATGSFVDYGMFLQSVMLMAVEEGLATCPQAALGEYPDIVRSFLGYDETCLLICGLALGYEDTSAPVNSYRTPRQPAADFTRFFST
ncbi:MAG: nitroreductase [Desulfofustis sp. PB-SRB1]|jgi:nitroreductase|nr:nitroreductase [Desulfofustis sp. PB-SRB1]MBM1000856.1 nitroreductase [Desulfofustis sp. PB-SRB1]HBH28233.1 nitroreductase [Desulfofustis sp.]HBH32046.1 nitroreductase [Desulfofustis sp.]